MRTRDSCGEPLNHFQRYEESSGLMRLRRPVLFGSDCYRAFLPADVPPMEMQNLPSPHPGSGRQQENPLILTIRGLSESPQLLLGKHRKVLLPIHLQHPNLERDLRQSPPGHREAKQPLQDAKVSIHRDILDLLPPLFHESGQIGVPERGDFLVSEMSLQVLEALLRVLD